MWRVGTISLRARILLSCVACLLLATLLQLLLFNYYSSSIISGQAQEINQNTLDNLSADIYSRFKTVENSLISVYAYRDFVRRISSAVASDRLTEDFGSIAYEIANNEFDAEENLVALYLYTMDHVLISAYRHAQTPIYTYPADIYDGSMRGSDAGVRDIIATSPEVMEITSYYNESRGVRLIRCVLQILENARTPVGYMVCDIDPKGFLSMMEKYRYADAQVLWLQPDGREALTRTPPIDEKAESAYLLVSTANTSNEAADAPGGYEIYAEGIRKYALSIYSMIPTTALNANQTLLTRSMLLVFFLVLAVAVILSILFSSRLTRPLAEMIGTMTRIRQGETRLRLKPMRQPEFERLGSAFNDMLDRIEALIARDYQTAIQLNEAKYAALQMQVNPHFLYNTLDTMAAIATAKDCPTVAALCRALSDLFRYSLNMDQPLASLADELKHLKNYMYVINVRTQGSIALDVDVPGELLAVRLPRLSLQPLVENAVQHGLRNKRGEKRVWICAEADVAELRVRIVDNGVGMPQELIDRIDAFDPSATQGKEDSIGLKNINARMKLLFGDDYGIRIESALGEGTRVTLRVPIRWEEINHE